MFIGVRISAIECDRESLMFQRIMVCNVNMVKNIPVGKINTCIVSNGDVSIN